MKKSLFTLSILFCACLFTFTANASKNGRLKSDSLSCLKIEGKINNANETQEECIIELISLNDQIDTITLKEGKIKFKFMLHKDSYYAIRISKAGYISKLVCVNTEILTQIDGIYVFEFETNLIKEEFAIRLNADILDFPIAIIHFDYENDAFSYNKEYSAYIKKELYNVNHTYSKKTKKETLMPLSEKTFVSAIN